MGRQRHLAQYDDADGVGPAGHFEHTWLTPRQRYLPQIVVGEFTEPQETLVGHVADPNTQASSAVEWRTAPTGGIVSIDVRARSAAGRPTAPTAVRTSKR